MKDTVRPIELFLFCGVHFVILNYFIGFVRFIGLFIHLYLV